MVDFRAQPAVARPTIWTYLCGVGVVLFQRPNQEPDHDCLASSERACGQNSVPRTVSGATQRDTLLVGVLGEAWSAFCKVQRLATKRFACSKRQRPRRLGVEQGNLFRLVPSEEGLILNAPLPRWLVHRRSPCQLLPPADRGASLRRICDGTKCQTLGTKIDPRRTARPRYSTSNI